MKDFSGIEFANEHNGTDVFRVIELAYEQGRKDGHSEQLGTNLAEVGTDAISRQAAIDALEDAEDAFGYLTKDWREVLEQLPPIQPEIVRCKDCKYAEYIDDVQALWCTECGQGRTVAPNDFCSRAERREE